MLPEVIIGSKNSKTEFWSGKWAGLEKKISDDWCFFMSSSPKMLAETRILGILNPKYPSIYQISINKKTPDIICLLYLFSCLLAITLSSVADNENQCVPHLYT